MKIRVKDQLVVATPDTGAAISIISSFLAEQLGLNVLPIPAQKIQALNSQTQIAGVIEDASLQIQQAKVPIHLRVVESQKPLLLLGMDWHKKYKVFINIQDNTLEFTTQGQRYKTVVEYGQEEQVNVFEYFWTEFVVEEENPRPLAYLAQPLSTKESSKILEEKREALLAKFPNIIFKDEKSAIITPLIRCKLYSKYNRSIREGVRNLGFHKRR